MKKKNLIRNIVIAVAAAAVIACIVVFSILLRQDAHGLNAFDRSKVVASADGQTVTMGEYVLGVDSSLNYYTYYGYSYTDEELKELQEGVANDLLLHKLYIAKLDELGLSLTADELAQCKKTAEEQLAALEESIGSQLAKSSNFSNANLQSQINDYFTRQLGMSKAQYKKYIETQEKAELAEEKIEAYYEAQIKDYSEEELIAYYDTYVTENYGENYESGAYSMQTYMYQIGYATLPYLYIPESFVYVDVLEYTASTEEEVLAMQNRFNDGESFDEIASAAGVTSLHDTLKAPYAIGNLDYGYLTSYTGIYTTASEMAVDETTAVIVPDTTTDDDGNETTSSYTLYLIKRCEGTMCENGAQYGVVDIDYYDGVREAVVSGFEASRFNDITEAWLSNKQISDAIYTYAG